MHRHIKTVLLLAAGFGFIQTFLSCGGHSTRKTMTADTIALAPCPRFEADSAMLFIEEQCSFGPRVTGSKESQLCGDYIIARFRQYGAEVTEEIAEVKLYDGSTLTARNITASLNKESSDRLLLCAHWDSRPWADNDPEEDNWKQPVLAANDGASGVAVLIELCRLLQQRPLPISIDFVCFDAEDLGAPEWEILDNETEDSWCLGSKAWAEKARQKGYQARYGILLDMVGGRGSTFSRERISRRYADPVVEKVWNIAGQLGYGHFFRQRDGGMLMDDHVYVNQVARIPCIDIVPYFVDGPSSFGPSWHTIQDTPENIDPSVLAAVGQTLTQLLYNEATAYDY